jgi:hypothetical protein
MNLATARWGPHTGYHRSTDQTILQGYYFGGGKKPVQPAMKPRLVDVSSVAKPICTVIAVCAQERVPTKRTTCRIVVHGKLGMDSGC